MFIKMPKEVRRTKCKGKNKDGSRCDRKIYMLGFCHWHLDQDEEHQNNEENKT